MSNSRYTQEFRAFRYAIREAIPKEEFEEGVFECLATLPKRQNALLTRREELAAFLRKTPAQQKKALLALPLPQAVELAAFAIGALNMAASFYETLDWRAVPLNGAYRENAAAAFLLACDVLIRICTGIEAYE